MLDTKKIYLESTSGIWRMPIISSLSIAVLKKLLHENEINTFLAKNGHLPAREFIGEVFQALNVNYQLNITGETQLPSSGRGIIVANHPLGGLDGLMILHAILSIRSDVKVIANNLLSRVKPLAPHIISVNNWKSDFSRETLTSLKVALQQEEIIIFFPAGEVSRKYRDKIEDRQWQKACYSLAKSCDAPLIPLFVEGKNSEAFYLMSKIAANVSTAMLAGEMFKKKNQSIGLTIGDPLEIEMLRKIPLTDKQIVQLIRQHVYQLKQSSQGVFQTPQKIAEPLEDELIQSAIKTCDPLGDLGNNHEILLYQPKKNTVLLQEIGRLRELTFREVGEGSGTARDLDQYDSYYQHLIVWEKEAREIMGAYRLYPSREVTEGRGITALYTENMFHFEGDLSWLKQGLEVGRGFIVPKYWNSRALDRMWQGIGAYYSQHPNMRYLFGSVSISPRYPKEMIDYLVSLYTIYMPSTDKIVKAKNPYGLTGKKLDKWRKRYDGLSFAEAEKLVKDKLSILGLNIPIFFKHYSALCEEGGVCFSDFGVDAEFGFTVDGFVIVDMHKLRHSKYQRYIAPYLTSPSE